MRVLHYHPRAAAGDGGISRSLRALSRAMVENGTEVTLVYDELGPAVDPTDGVRWLRLEHRGPARARLPTRFAEVVEEHDIVTLHSAWTAHNARAAAVCRAVGVPYLIAPRGAYDPAIQARRRLVRRAWWSAFERDVVAGAHAAHVFFTEQGVHLRELGFTGPLVVAPNGVAAPPDLRWDEGSGGHVLYLGRYDPEHKGLDLLVRALALLAPDVRPQVRLHGSDWQGGRRDLEALVSELDLERWVHVGGHLSGAAKWEAITTARGLVYPSRWEGFGNSVAEAAAVGVPVLVTPYPLGRYLAERHAAVLADPTPEGVASGLRRLLGPDGAEFGRRAAATAQAELSWPAVASRWSEQLANVL